MSKNAVCSWTCYCKDMISKSGNVRFWSFMVVTVNKWSKSVRKCKIRTGTITTFASVDCFVPVGFWIYKVNNCGSATRADSISAMITSGIANPRGRSDFPWFFSVNILPAFRLVPVDFRIHRVITAGLRTARMTYPLVTCLGDCKSPRTS